MEPRCNHLGNTHTPSEIGGHIGASMEPRCNHLGNRGDLVTVDVEFQPQWSPGVITWETVLGRRASTRGPKASMEPRCNHLGNGSPKQWANCRRFSVAFAGCGADGEEAATHGGYRYGSAAYQAFLLRGLRWASSATGPFATKREEIHPGVAFGRP